jgi:glycine/D-amino acid oxidase-like deaminating enzyme
MSHRDPSSPGWALAARSKALWEAAAAAGGPLAAGMEWQVTGSLLLAATAEEVAALPARRDALTAAGVRGAIVLQSRELAMREPALQLPPGGAALLVPDDAQIVSMSMRRRWW